MYLYLYLFISEVLFTQQGELKNTTKAFLGVVHVEKF
jgi:hypothetical protein